MSSGVGSEDGQQPLDTELDLSGCLTPSPLPPSRDATDWVEATRGRLASLHTIIQRSIDYADIPRRGARPQRAPLSTPSPPHEAEGTAPPKEQAYMVCVEQLVLAQFESLSRKDIMLSHAASYMSLREAHIRGVRAALEAPPLLRGAHPAMPSESRDFSCTWERMCAVLHLMWEEGSARHSVLIEEVSDRGAMVLDHAVHIRTSDATRGTVRPDDRTERGVTLLQQSEHLARLLLRWESMERHPSREPTNEEDDDNNSPMDPSRCVAEVPNTTISPFPNDVELSLLPTDVCADADADVFISPHAAPKMRSPNQKATCAFSTRHLTASPPSCLSKVLLDTPPKKFPTFSGDMYRSNVPHVMWQLRFFHFENGLLRFSMSANKPVEQKRRWWTVLTASDIVHVEMDDLDEGVGEAKPPLGRNKSCCFSVYFRTSQNHMPRRLRCCCLSQSDTVTWVFALRHAAKVIERRKQEHNDGMDSIINSPLRDHEREKE